MSYFVRQGSSAQGSVPVYNFRCPYCRHNGAFHPFSGLKDLSWEQHPRGAKVADTRHAGLRRCPNTECNGVVFVVRNDRLQTIDVLPPETIDFDATSLPDKVLASLEEAVKCHAAGCFKASALMVRRLLEELCDDRGSKGSDLKKRIIGLSDAVVVPPELLTAAHELRLLGNDAAHVNAKAYDEVGRREVEAAIALAKELLKAVYQYAALLDQLRALKTPQP